MADGTVAAVRQMAGTEDLEQAFLRLIKGHDTAEAAWNVSTHPVEHGPAKGGPTQPRNDRRTVARSWSSH